MTREEAINRWVIPAINNMWNEQRCKEILEALEHEHIFDKIKADIINIADSRRSIPVRSVIKIIDKYQVQSEEKTSDE